MNVIRYHIGFEIVFRHDYYGTPPRHIADFRVEPTPECRLLLSQKSLHFKTTEESAIVFFSKPGNMNLVAAGERVSFYMYLTQKNFWEKTNPLPLANLRFGRRIRWFSNLGQNPLPVGQYQQKLTKGNFAGAADIATFNDLQLSIPAKIADPLQPVYQKGRIRMLLNTTTGAILTESPVKNGFINIDARPWGTGTYLLELDKASGGQDSEVVVLYDRNHPADTPFASIDVFKQSTDAAGNPIDYDTAGLEYLVDFQTKSLPWTYHLIFDEREVKDSTLQITSDDLNLSFTRSPAPPPGLAGQFRPLKVATFQSTTPVRASIRPPQRTLLLRYEKFTGTPRQHERTLPLPALSPATTVFFTI